MKIKQIAEFLDSAFVGDGAIEISRVADLKNAREHELSFVEKADSFTASGAACLLVPEDFDAEISGSYIRVKHPKLAFAKIAQILYQSPAESGIHPNAEIHASARIGAKASVGAFATIGENTKIGDGARIFGGARIGSDVSIGKNSVIHPNCVIYDRVSIGDDCTIHAGAIIGADGFGYVRDGERGYVKFPQIGTVIIEDDVEIGANSCIDRGALGETRIGAGTKIDNLVQIAHNVKVGKRVVIAAQTGISGSTVIEDDCVIGGQVGMGDHAVVKSGAIIGSQAGILPGKIVRAGVWWGTPVQPLDEYKRQNAMVKGLGRLKEEIKELKNRFANDKR